MDEFMVFTRPSFSRFVLGVDGVPIDKLTADVLTHAVQVCLPEALCWRSALPEQPEHVPTVTRLANSMSEVIVGMP